MQLAKHADGTFFSTGCRLTARDELSIASGITANDHIDTNEYLRTYEKLATSDVKILLRNPDEEAQRKQIRICSN